MMLRQSASEALGHVKGLYDVCINIVNGFVCLFFQAAKMANYAKYQRLCNVLFIMFALVFISSRLGLYPVW